MQRLVIEDLAQTSRIEHWEPPKHIVSGYSTGVRAFLRPDLYAVNLVIAEQALIHRSAWSNLSRVSSVRRRCRDARPVAAFHDSPQHADAC